jgi:hypothetical protein
MRDSDAAAHRCAAISKNVPRGSETRRKIIPIRLRLVEQQLFADSRDKCVLVISRQTVEDVLAKERRI